MTWRSSAPARRPTTPAATGRASRRRPPSRSPHGRRRSPGPTPTPPPDANAGRLAAALGVGAAPLAVAPGAGGRHHALASALVDALWEATGGYYASELLDPHGSDAITDGVRVHAAAALHASGPLPAIRLGPQPYGVLPVAPRRLAPHLDSAVDLNLHRFSGMLRFMWEEQLDRVPRLGRVGETQGVDDVLLELLQRTPVPWELRWREMVPPPQWTASEWLATFRTRQAPWLYDITDRLDIPPNRPARIQYLTASRRQPSARRATRRQGRRRHARTSRRSRRSLARATRVAGSSTCARTRSPCSKRCWPSPPCRSWTRRRRRSWWTASPWRVGRRPASCAGASAPPTSCGWRSPTRSGSRCSSRRPERSPRRPLPAPSSRCTTRWRRACAAPTCRITSASRRARSTGSPGSSPPSTCSRRHRPTSWSGRSEACSTCSAPASTPGSRPSPPPASHELRAERPQGVHVGCYGWVEDLHPDRGPAADSLGYIAAPSLAHAVTAALLRSGRQSHLRRGCVRPRHVVGACARSAEAARGRGRRPAARRAARLPDRAQADRRRPGRADRRPPASPRRCGPAPATSTRRSNRWPRATWSTGSGCSTCCPRNSGSSCWRKLQVTGDRQTRLEAVLREVAGTYDAVSDVLFAEAVHQTAAGNLDRAAAAAGALDRQERPVEPDVTRTPRDGAVVTNRVVVALRGSATARAVRSGRPAACGEPPNLASTTGWVGPRRPEAAHLHGPPRPRRHRHRPRTGERRGARPVAFGLRPHRRPARRRPADRAGVAPRRRLRGPGDRPDRDRPHRARRREPAHRRGGRGRRGW